MSSDKISVADTTRLVNMIEYQMPGVSFDSLCVFVSETVFCCDKRVSASHVRAMILNNDIPTLAERPQPSSLKNLFNRILCRPRRPFCVSYGMGVDSTSMLIHLARMYNSQRAKCPQYRPDSITFADTGSEKRETYAYLPVIQDYLKQMGFPPVTVVRYQPNEDRVKHGMYYTLEQDCLVKGMLPSWAYGMKGCSHKWKIGPQHKARSAMPECQAAWKAGQHVIVAIGYDAGPKDAKRRWNIKNDEHYEYIYPLIELGWDRERCIEEIRAEGLPGFETDRGGRWLKNGGVPVKSACWFCPSTQPEELDDYAQTEHGRDYLRAIVRMEDNAAPNLTDIDGLWRNGVKGTRGGVAKPGRMADYIEQKGLLNGRTPLPLLESYNFDEAEECAGCF